jgi:hypothetical protein
MATIISQSEKELTVQVTIGRKYDVDGRKDNGCL